jgi:hypothetical protein
MAKTKVIKQLNTVLILSDGTGAVGNTTSTAAVAAAATVIPVAATTNFAIGDTIRVDSGELVELAVVSVVTAGVSLTVSDPLTFAHASGVAVVEQFAYDIGDVEGGVTVRGAAQTSDVLVATRRMAYTILNGYTDLSIEFGSPVVTLGMLAFALGIPLTNVLGAGTTADPFSLVTDGNDFTSEANMSIVAIGVTMDGVPLRVELWGVDMDPSGFSLAMKTGTHAATPMKGVAAAGGVVTTNASAYVANTSQKAVKGKTFDLIQDMGMFIDSGTTTTTSAILNIGDKTNFAVVASAGFAIADWVRIDTGDSVEFHQVDAIPDGTHLSIRSRIKFAHASGVAVTKQTLTSFGNIAEDGATLSISGSSTPIRSATRRLSLGVKPGSAAMNMAAAVIDHSLSNIARALGIPQASIVGARLPIDGTKIGTDVVNGVYFRGVTQDGWKLWVNLWSTSQDLSGFLLALNNTGVQTLPIAYRPLVVHFIQTP